jgi:hypothetical protein
MGTTLTLGFFSQIEETNVDAFDDESRIVTDRLSFMGKHYEIWARIYNLNPEPRALPWSVEWWGSDPHEPWADRTQEDGVGAPLTYVRAGEIASIADDEPERYSLHRCDQAIFTYLKALPPETIVILWWS